MTLMAAVRTRDESKSAPNRWSSAYFCEPVLVLDQLFLGVRQARRVLVRAPLLQQMPKCLTKEAAGTAGGVEDGLVFLRVEDVDHEPDRGRGVKYWPRSPRRLVADEFLVGDALDVGVGAQ